MPWLDLGVAASPPRESDEEMANLQGAGVVLAPLSLPSALFQIPGVDFVMPPSTLDVLLDECPGDWLAVQAVPQYRDTGAQLMLAAAAAGGPPRMDEPVVDVLLTSIQWMVLLPTAWTLRVTEGSTTSYRLQPMCPR